MSSNNLKNKYFTSKRLLFIAFFIVLCTLFFAHASGKNVSYAQDSAVASIPFSQVVTVDGVGSAPNIDVNYILAASEPTPQAPLPGSLSVCRVVRRGNDNAPIKISYSNPGLYFYTLHIGRNKVKGFTFDKKVWRIIVLIGSSSGGNPKVSQIVIMSPKGEKASAASYQHSFKPPVPDDGSGRMPPGSKPKTGDNAPIAFWILSIMISCSFMIFAIARRKNRKYSGSASESAK